MKISPACLLVLATLVSSRGGDVPGADAFCETIRKAVASHDGKTLAGLTYSEGLSEDARARQPNSFNSLFLPLEIFSVSLGPLPKNYQPFLVANGRRYEPTHAPDGVVVITYKKPPQGLTSEFLAYAVINGTCRLIATKSTDLGWKGPPDVPLGFLITGEGADRATTAVRYNASGVDLTETVETPSASLLGQHFQEITVNPADPRHELTLTVVRAGQEIYKSPPQKGPIVYRKP